MRGSTFRTAGWLVAAGLLGAAVLAPSALATKPAPDHKVTICHATASDRNPYVRETVDIASSGYLKSGHNNHTGPIWDATLKGKHTKWGDIIPPYTYFEFAFSGLNWTTQGQAIWNDDCAIPEATGSPAASPSESLPAEKTSAPSPSASEGSSPTGAVEGETSGPTGAVEGATGAAEPTLPASDAVDSVLTGGGSGLSLILLALSGLAAAAMLVPSRARRQ